ncbi:MAG: AAA family ATPase [Lachnospiraceae bacterium]|nr:AAA family ATPase [Lachnospiraceae bacterium]
MKIESLYIENFGKLHGFSLEFYEGTNVIKENNGWGKSTLATFIRAMFYGFEGEGRQKLSDNERKRFRPWQGGAYGGNLVFETKGKRYRIERFFGSKQSEDTFLLRNADTGIECFDFGANIGEKLFHINSESFRKTVFISQNDCANFGTSGDINSRIGNIEDSIDLNKYEAADKSLKEAINHLSANKTGKQGKLQAAISEIRGRLLVNSDAERLIKVIKDGISAGEDELENLLSIKRQLNHNQVLAAGEEKRKVLKNNYDLLSADYDEKEKEYLDLLDYFKGNPVSEEKIILWENMIADMSRNRELAEKSILTPDEESFLNQYDSLFYCKNIRRSEIEHYKEIARELKTYIEESECFVLSESEEREMDFYKTIFANDTNPKLNARCLSDEWDEKINLEKDLLIYTNTKDELLEENGKKKRIRRCASIAFLSGAVLLACCGLILFIQTKKTACLFAAIFCAVLLAAGICTFILGKKAEDKLLKKLKIIQDDINSKEKRTEVICSDLEKYIKKHNLVCEGDVREFLWTINSNATIYEKLRDKENAAKSRKHTSEAENIKKELSDFLNEFAIEADCESYVFVINELWSNYIRYVELFQKREEHSKALNLHNDIKEQLIRELNGYGLIIEEDLSNQVETIKTHLNKVSFAERILIDSKNKKTHFEECNDMNYILTNPDIEFDSIEEINRQLLELEDLIKEKETLLVKDRKDLDTQYERLQEYSDDLEELEELEKQLSDTKSKCETISLVKEFMGRAKDNLTSRYIGPLQDGFDYYYRILAGDNEKYTLNANIELTKDEQGALRNTDMLSYGYRDLCGFCFRLSMADAMYKGEKPVLILDDPFVNLDDEKMEGAKKLLLEVSNKYQIIYLTYRENRL